MRDDELDNMMDGLLKDAMSGSPAPQLSAAFESRLMRRVRPPRLTSTGRLVMALYVVFAAAAAGWLMRELPVTWVAAAVVLALPIAAGTGAYARRIVFDN